MANEKRLIDADALNRALIEEYHGMLSDETLKIYQVIRILDERPTVDAVEVVRCKDCKHWMKDVAGCTDSVGRCEWANYMVGAVGYCVYGERKDNG